MAYQNILENLIESLPDIHGAFIYNNQQGVLDSQDRIATNTLQKQNIGKAFSKVFFMMAVHYNDISNIRFNYKKMTLLGGKFGENDYLIVLCGADISSGITRITVQMALNNLKENDETLTEAQPTISEQPAISPEQLLQADSPLAQPLNDIRHALADQIGPVADILFDDALATWAKEVTPTHDTLNKLVQILVEEIGDSSEGEEFRTLVSNLL